MASARDGCPGRMLPGASIPFGTLAWWEAGGMSGLFVFSASLAGRPLIRRSLPQTRFQRGVVSAPPRVTACLGRGVDLDTASKRSPEATPPSRYPSFGLRLLPPPLTTSQTEAT